MKTFTEALRYEHELTPESRVLDVGGYEGAFSEEIRKRYGCHVVCLEPVGQFFWPCLRRLAPVGVTVLPLGLASRSCFRTFKIQGCMSGEYASGHSTEVKLTTPDELLSNLGWETVQLLKLNCEGAEFEILEHIFSTGAIRKYENLQIQFHGVVENAAERIAAIHQELAKTHDCEYACDVWEGWKIKP